MELTKEQLQIVKNYLNAKDITYMDIRLEVLDHIVSDIEAKMKEGTSDFEAIFENIKDKWNKHLEKSSSFYFGELFSAPKIVLEKAKKYFKKWYFIHFLMLVIPYLALKIIDQSFLENRIDTINASLQILTILSFLIFLCLFILKLKEKRKTTYSYILKTQSWNFLFGFLVLFDFNFINGQGDFQASQVAILVSFVFGTYCYFHFFKKHKQAIQKYKIL